MLVVRLLTIVSAGAFHFSIWLTMSPNYFPQTLCYFLGVALPWIGDQPAETVKFSALPHLPGKVSPSVAIAEFSCLSVLMPSVDARACDGGVSLPVAFLSR